MPDPRPPVLLLTAIPADLMNALGAECELITAEDASGQDPARFDVAVTTAMRGLNAADFATFPGLKLVLSQGVGRDKLDLVSADAAGAAVSITPNILTEDVADFAIGLLYAIARQVVAADRFVRSGRWGPQRMALSTSLNNKTIGIVGMGRIGQAIARRAQGLGMKVMYHIRQERPDLPYSYAASPTALAAAVDFLLLACPGGAQTEGLCSADVLKALGPDGYVVNISRGSVVDEEALLTALESNAIAGAGLDVFATEPGLNPRFLTLENVVLTPHSATLTHEVRAELIGAMLAELAAYRAGQPLAHRVN